MTRPVKMRVPFFSTTFGVANGVEALTLLCESRPQKPALVVSTTRVVVKDNVRSLLEFGGVFFMGEWGLPRTHAQKRGENGHAGAKIFALFRAWVAGGAPDAKR